jgi:group I intron endonuclease
MKSGIYQIKCIVTNEVYIGSSKHLKKRISHHKCKLRQGSHGNRYLQSAWQTHGETAFIFEAIIYCQCNNLLLYEQLAIDNLSPSYNIAPFATSTLGIKRSAEYVERMRKRLIGNHNGAGNRGVARGPLGRFVPKPSRRRFSAEQIREMRILRKQGLILEQIAKRFDTTKQQIGQIVRGKNYANIE